MKRLILVAILVFPIISLVGWLLWGITRPRDLPTATDSGTNISAVMTNAPAGATNGSPAK